MNHGPLLLNVSVLFFLSYVPCCNLFKATDAHIHPMLGIK